MQGKSTITIFETLLRIDSVCFKLIAVTHWYYSMVCLHPRWERNKVKIDSEAESVCILRVVCVIDHSYMLIINHEICHVIFSCRTSLCSTRLDALVLMQLCMNLDNLKSLKGQNIMFLNIRSLYPHISELQAELSCSSLLCLCLCEMWLTPRIDSRLVCINGYNMCRVDRKIKKRGGGLVIYIRTDLDYEIIDLISNENIEMVTVLIKRKLQKTYALV